MNKIYLLFIFLFTLTFNLAGQETTPIIKEVGINMTPFAAQLIPFNETTLRTGPYDFSFKRYKGDRAFRLGLGMHLRPDFFFGDNQLNSFNLRIGFERRKQIYKNWHYTRAFDAFFYGGSLNLPTDLSDDDGGLGGAVGFGIEYHLNDWMYLSTEGSLMLGFSGNSGILMEFIPPMALFIHMRFKK